MAVMTASVKTTGNFRCPGMLSPLIHRQRVHVRAKADTTPARSSFDDADNAGAGNPDLRLDAN